MGWPEGDKGVAGGECKGNLRGATQMEEDVA